MPSPRAARRRTLARGVRAARAGDRATTACRCRCSPTCSTPSRRTRRSTRYRRPRRAARLLPPLGQPGRPPAAAPLRHRRRARAGPLGRDLHRAAARQLLAGPRRRRRARPALRAGGRRRAPRRRARRRSSPDATAPTSARAGRASSSPGTRELMRAGAPLVHAVPRPRRLGAAPGRAGRPAHPRADRSPRRRDAARAGRRSAGPTRRSIAWRALTMRGGRADRGPRADAAADRP